MFEQSLYQEERVATPLHEGDLFYKYEIRSWELSPRVYRILGISALANILAVLIVAQTSLLTMKGCDSPLVGSVCQVLDTVYLASNMMMGTDREYIDAAYEKTDLADSDITFVDVTGVTPPLSYPEGYFQIANPVEYAMMQQQMMDPMMMDPAMAGLPSGMQLTTPSTGGSLLDTPQVVPTPNPSVVQGQMPSFGSSGVTTTPPRKSRNKVVDLPLPDENDTAEKDERDEKPHKTPQPAATPLSSEAVTAVEINKKPLTDFADDVASKLEANEIDLSQPFMVVLNGVLTNEGKLDRQKSRFDTAKQKGDPKMINVAKAALEAVGDSGFLTYLKSLDVERVTVTLVQDDKQIVAVVSSSQASPERARTIASALNSYISIGKIAVKNPSDERTLLDSAKASDDGKNFVLNFSIPKPVAQEMMNRKLKEAQAKKLQQPQPSGNTTANPSKSSAK